MRNPLHEKFSFMAGCLAFIVPMFLFRVDFLALSPLLKVVLCAHLVAAMGVCGIVGEYRWRLGLVVLPLLFLALCDEERGRQLLSVRWVGFCQS
jgi:peptidoglycan/LPS O-acetylase OafA/YrhL